MKRRIFFLIYWPLLGGLVACQPQRAAPTPEITVQATTFPLLPTPTPTTPPTPTRLAASPTPTPTPRPAVIPTPISGEVEYVVQAGDNLFRISLRFGSTVEAILERNPGVEPEKVEVGQVLIIPITGAPSEEFIYVVQPGDNLFRIALRFNTTVEAIQAANGLEDTTIYVGQELIIPPPTDP